MNNSSEVADTNNARDRGIHYIFKNYIKVNNIRKYLAFEIMNTILISLYSISTLDTSFIHNSIVIFGCRVS